MMMRVLGKATLGEGGLPRALMSWGAADPGPRVGAR